MSEERHIKKPTLQPRDQTLLPRYVAFRERFLARQHARSASGHCVCFALPPVVAPRGLEECVRNVRRADLGVMEAIKKKKAEQAKAKDAAEQAVRNTKGAQQRGLVRDQSFNAAQEAILIAKEVGASTVDAERMLKEARAAAEKQRQIDEAAAVQRQAAEAQAAREAAFKAEGKVAPENFFDALRSDSDEDKTMALHQLTDLVDRIEGEDEWELCAELRDQGSIVDIGKCIGHQEPHMHQPALLLLATLTTEDVDPQADETKLAMKNGGIFDLIWPHLFSNVALTVAFACAVVQNTISDQDFTNDLHENGGLLHAHSHRDGGGNVRSCAKI